MQRRIYFVAVKQEGETFCAYVIAIAEGANVLNANVKNRGIVSLAPFQTMEEATKVAITLNHGLREEGKLSDPSLNDRTAPVLHWF